MPVSLRTCSARGCSRAEGSGESIAASVPGAWAKPAAAAKVRCRASFTPACLAWTTRTVPAATPNSSRMINWSTNICPATLRAPDGSHLNRPESAAAGDAPAGAEASHPENRPKRLFMMHF